MSRLIDADTLWKHKFKSASENMDLDVVYIFGWNDAIDSIVENAPTVDAEPIRHGHWEWNDYGGFGNYHCTVCRYIPYGEFSMYCPRCGAKMDEEVQQNETD